MDITKFEESHGLEKGEVTKVLQKKYSKFSKTSLSLARRPKETGVKLTGAAESYLKLIYDGPKEPKPKSAKTSVQIPRELYQQMLESGLTATEIISEALAK